MSNEITITISAETINMIENAFALTRFSGRENVRIKRQEARNEFYEAVAAARSAQ